MREEKEQMSIVRELMRIDTGAQTVDMQKIDNRRFMYDSKTSLLILGEQYGKTKGLPGSHAEDLAKAGVGQDYDGFVRGWIGTGKEYPHGVIHFAPHIESGNIPLFEKAFDTLLMFQQNGAQGQTVVRGFGSVWERPLSAVLQPEPRTEQKPSVREKLKQSPARTKAPQKKRSPHRER